MTVFSHAARQGATRDKFLMTEFHQAIALRPQSVAAIEALAATPHHGPCDAICELERRAAIIQATARANAGDLAHHFVAQDAWCGRGAASETGMQIAAANGGAAHANEQFTGRQRGNRKLLKRERLTRGTKHGRKRGGAGLQARTPFCSSYNCGRKDPRLVYSHTL